MNSFVHRLRHHDAGATLVEFALALPIILLVGFGGIEFMTFVLAHQKLERVASTTADAIARNTVAPSERIFVDTLRAVERVGAPFRINARGRTIITGVIGVRQDGAVRNKIVWQRCGGDLTSIESEIGREWTRSSDYAEGPSVTLPSNLILMQNQMAVVTEVAYRYEPMMRLTPLPGAPADGIIRQRSVFVARGRPFPNVTPSPGVERARCS